jgi:hypothetical protein
MLFFAFGSLLGRPSSNTSMPNDREFSSVLQGTSLPLVLQGLE